LDDRKIAFEVVLAMSLRFLWLSILLAAVTVAAGSVGLQVDTGISMPWSGYLKNIETGEKIEIIKRANFRAFFQTTIGYTFFEEHSIEAMISPFSIESRLEQDEEEPAEYTSRYVQDTYRLRYRYLLPPLERFCLQIGLHATLHIKELVIGGSMEYTNGWTDFSFGPSALISLSMNEIVSLVMEVEAGIGRDNGFLDIFAGLNLSGPFYFVRVGIRNLSTNGFSGGEALSTSFWNFGAQFRAVF
jgi:hypothetical protein